MMDHIMNNRLSLEFGQTYARIPLEQSPHIHNADALTMDWAELLPPEGCSYVLGNPPFVGQSYQSPTPLASSVAGAITTPRASYRRRPRCLRQLSQRHSRRPIRSRPYARRPPQSTSNPRPRCRRPLSPRPFCLGTGARGTSICALRTVAGTVGGGSGGEAEEAEGEEAIKLFELAGIPILSNHSGLLYSYWPRLPWMVPKSRWSSSRLRASVSCSGTHSLSSTFASQMERTSTRSFSCPLMHSPRENPSSFASLSSTHASSLISRRRASSHDSLPVCLPGIPTFSHLA